MARSAIKLTRDQREAICQAVRTHLVGLSDVFTLLELGSIEDFWVALERSKNFAAVERMGKEFAEDFRLLQDIGWSEYEARETHSYSVP